MAEDGAQSFEKLGAFYLGREIDGPAADPTDAPVLYDSKDLTTHGVIVGMTGSGKTGLAIGMLEEAAIDGIPSIAIDVKGDLTNLLLTFPELRTEDFRPWIDEGAAARKGQTPDEFAAKTASLWKNGIAGWGQDGDRIRRLQEAVDFKLYTPGASKGVPMSLLGSLGKPSSLNGPADTDAERTQILGTVSSLLTLIGIDPDPIRSREHIFLSNILSWAWGDGRELSLADLIGVVQKPPFDTVGVIDLASFFPSKDRMGLAMALNNLLASPSFSAWREGVPLSIPDLLYGPTGKPRHSVLYLAHLSDSERMFFVTRLLNDVVAWMRTQAGTGSLRALIYMDEVFGYLPPTANPPSKLPLLTLLKQARAFGVGVVLATQNPVDLDYKALSNAGTWMLGRLQTERDKLRVLDGLEGASGGGGFDRAEVDAILSALGKRRFMLHNVHEDGPVLFQTRWVLSYLAGPLTLDRACALAQTTVDPNESPQRTGDSSLPARPVSQQAARAENGEAESSQRPMVPTGIDEVFLEGALGAKQARLKARVLLQARLHYVRSSWGIDSWKDVSLLADPGEADLWEGAQELEQVRLSREPDEAVTYLPAPSGALRVATHKSWKRSAKAALYRTATITLLRCAPLKESSQPGETEAEFRMRLRHKARELRDTQIEKLRRRYDAKIDRLEKRIASAEERVSREESQYQEQKMSSILDIGSTILGSFLGRKRVSRGTLSGVTRAARRFGRASKEKGDIGFAVEKLKVLQGDMAEIESELEDALADLRDTFEVDLLDLETLDLGPRKSDIEIIRLALAWEPA
jgi:Helicase HerA-like C-terminal